MTNLDDLYIFKRVVDCGGISAAGRSLDIPKSTIARRIADLEASLGNILFLRNTRKFLLTPFGEICYEHAKAIASEAESLFDAANTFKNQPGGSLHIVCPPVLGASVLEEIAVDFAAASPNVRLYLEETTSVFDPRTVQADLVIYPTFAELPDVAVIVRRIASLPFILVGHVDLLEDKQLLSPQDLKTFKCLGLGPRRGGWQWTLRRQDETITVDFDPVFSGNLPSAVLQAARHALGIAAMPLALCQSDLQEGVLVQVLPDWSPQPVNIYAVFPSTRAMTLAARQFLDLVIARLKLME